AVLVLVEGHQPIQKVLFRDTGPNPARATRSRRGRRGRRRWRWRRRRQMIQRFLELLRLRFGQDALHLFVQLLKSLSPPLAHPVMVGPENVVCPRFLFVGQLEVIDHLFQRIGTARTTGPRSSRAPAGGRPLGRLRYCYSDEAEGYSQSTCEQSPAY